MTVINLEIAKELNGSNPYTAAIFVDSYGKTFLQEITLDDMQGDCKLLIENPFIPCNYCGVPVLDSSIVPGYSGMCDNCYKAGPNQPNTCKAVNHNQCMHCGHDENCQHQESNFGKNASLILEGLGSILSEKVEATMEDRIKAAVYMASDKFWATIAGHFPECKTGDLEPNYVFKMEETMQEAVTHWIELNKPDTRAQFLSCKGLHWNSFWYLIKSDIDCDVAVSTNIEVLDRHFYIAIDRKSVSFHEDTFNTALLYNEQVEWFFGDNPTVLMNYLDEYTVGYDTCKLFDDIMTIGKSNKV